MHNQAPSAAALQHPHPKLETPPPVDENATVRYTEFAVTCGDRKVFMNADVFDPVSGIRGMVTGVFIQQDGVIRAQVEGRTSTGGGFSVWCDAWRLRRFVYDSDTKALHSVVDFLDASTVQAR